MITCNYRKTTEAADNINLGLKLNTTEVRGTIAVGDTNDETQSRLATWFYGPRVTNHLTAGNLMTDSILNANTQDILVSSADAPTVEITQIIIRAKVDNALITMGVTETHVYSYASS